MLTALANLAVAAAVLAAWAGLHTTRRKRRTMRARMLETPYKPHP